VVALAKKNPNVAMILSFLYKCVETFICYFKDLEEESVRDNFVVIYELLDEMLDFGYKFEQNLGNEFVLFVKLSTNNGTAHSARIYHPRNTSIGNCTSAPNGRDQCRLMAFGRHKISKK
jgi:hypothetical protein